MASFALGSLGVKSFSRHCSLLGALAFRALYVIVRTGCFGVQSVPRHCSLLKALVFRAFHVTVNSWQPR